MRVATSWAVLAAMMASLTLSRTAQASDPPPETSSSSLAVHERYEGKLIEWALGKTQLRIDPTPAGKTIERVVIVRESIIAESDPYPDALNWVHVTTHEYIIRQELLIAEGHGWNADRVRESERNLRRLPILAVARLVPCQGSSPDRVVLLVVTKDLWSIRFNSSFEYSGSVLERFDLFPTETNFLGRNKSLGIHFGITQLELFTDNDGVIGPFRDSMVFGQQYSDPRILGTRLFFSESFNVYLNGSVPSGGTTRTGQTWQPTTESGSFGGVEAALSFGRPLYSLATQWGASISGTIASRQIRSYRQNPTDTTPPPGEQQGLSLRAVQLEAVDASGAQVVEAVPRVYDLFSAVLTAQVTRSFGLVHKRDISLGVDAQTSERETPDGFDVFDPAILEEYLRSVVPRSSSTVEPFLAYEDRGTTYIRLHNIQTFALTEDYLLGHQLNAELRGGFDLDDFAHSFMQGSVSVAYRWMVAENMFTAALAGQLRWQPNLSELDPTFSGQLSNSLVGVTLRHISPLLWIGRLHLLFAAQVRHNDLNRNVATLGSDTMLTSFVRPNDISFLYATRLDQGGLRGYPSNSFEGRNIFHANAEFRTLPLNFWTFHAGAIVFYDGGAVFGGDDPRSAGRTVPFHYLHSVGLGFRGQFPQFDRTTLRIDFGVPLNSPGGTVGNWFSASFGQSF